MKLLKKALEFGNRKHEGQVRKVTRQPYIFHPIEVSFIVMKHKRSAHLEELLCASILHDTLEDTDTTFLELCQEFTPLVASLVLELTSDSEAIKVVGKNEYLKKKLVGMSSYGLLLKLADRYANVTDNPSLKYAQDTRDLITHVQANRRLSDGQAKIAKEIISTVDGIIAENNRQVLQR